MKVPLSWLKQYIDVSLTPSEIAYQLTMAGLEVDSFTDKSLPFENVIAVKILKKTPHPNADKLCVATVSDNVNEYQVVCGAPNCREGLITAFAPIGALLYDTNEKPFKIKKGKLRGVESEGMLCSGKELQLSDDADGIIELPLSTQIGISLQSLYSDTIFEISITPNLNHCSSIIGIARELSAIIELPFTLPYMEIEESNHPIDKLVSIVIENEQHCPRYTCRVILDVTVEPSPLWLQQKLIDIGIHPINNIVDITNYVLMEYGHPIHAFDYDTVSNHKIIVKNTNEDEVFVTLDGKERILPKNALMICDSDKPIALAGILGGQNSEISYATKNVLLESAYFHPSIIRKTSKHIGLQTESSKRFERGADPNNAIPALNRATVLIQKLTKGNVAKGIIDVKKSVFTEKKLSCRLSRINLILGTNLSSDEVIYFFNRLKFGIHYDNNNTFKISVPTYRIDIHEEIDLIEEIAKLYGYNNIPKKPVYYKSNSLSHSKVYLFEQKVRSKLIAEGLQEFVSCDLISPQLNQITSILPKPISPVQVINPTSIENSVLRLSLLPNILQILKHNDDYNNLDIHGFEIGNIHFKENNKYTEISNAAIVLTGNRQPPQWDITPENTDFFDLKGHVENLLLNLGIKKITFKPSDNNNFHPHRQAEIIIDKHNIGILGEIHPFINRKIDFKKRILFAEISLHALLGMQQVNKKIDDLPIYPCSERDWTITLKTSFYVIKIIDYINSINFNFLERISLKNVYHSKELGADKRNVTFHFVYRNKKKTISYENVEEVHSQIKEKVLNKFNDYIIN